MVITQELKLYNCRRDTEGWQGGLLIVARNWQEAKAIFEAKEGKPPINIRETKIRPGVIYDDQAR